MKPKSLSSICTKHYYTSTTLSAGTSAALNMGIGSERIASTLGTRKNLGVLCEAIYGTVSEEIIAEMNNKVEKAGETIENSYIAFDKTADLDTPYLYFENEYIANCGDPDPDRYASFWFHPDHLGSSNYITDMSGNISQHMEYLPFGETLVEEHKNSNNSPYKFNGKELDDETGNYYYGARYYNPKWSFWLSVDPLAEKYPGWSPYNYTLLNPVKLVDPDGRSVDVPPGDFYNENGRYLGTDGIDDGKIYVVKTTGTSFDSGVSSTGISKSEYRATKKFIKHNSGNTSAFESNSIAYDNSVELVGGEGVRESMVNIVNNDNGRGGTSDANNREYGGVVRNGKVIESPAGPVGNPKTDLDASITHPDVRAGDITFHSHPSGQIIEGPGSNTIGGKTSTYYWRSAPSKHDVRNESGTGYEFSRGNGTIYIYNSSGVMATFPQKDFVNPKK